MRRLTAIAFIAVVFAVVADRPASADSGQVSATSNDDGADVSVLDLGKPGTPTRSTGGSISCSYLEVGEELNPFGYGDVTDQLVGFNSPDELVEGWWYYVACTINGDPQGGRFFQYTPGDLPIDAEFLALEARDTLTLAFPEPHTSPPVDLQQLVGLRTWLWITPDGYQPVSATASIPGLTVTATATPTQIVWDMGDDTDPIVCDGPGTAYDTDISDDQQSTDCSHVYQWAGDHTAAATVTWTIAWSATNGDGGTLPSVDRTTTFDLDVIERQAVIVDDP